MKLNPSYQFWKLYYNQHPYDYIRYLFKVNPQLKPRAIQKDINEARNIAELANIFGWQVRPKTEINIISEADEVLLYAVAKMI